MEIGEVREDFELWYSEDYNSIIPIVGEYVYLGILDPSFYFNTNQVSYYKILVVEILTETRILNRIGNEVVSILFKGRVEAVE